MLRYWKNVRESSRILNYVYTYTQLSMSARTRTHTHTHVRAFSGPPIFEASRLHRQRQFRNFGKVLFAAFALCSSARIAFTEKLERGGKRENARSNGSWIREREKRNRKGGRADVSTLCPLQTLPLNHEHSGLCGLCTATRRSCEIANFPTIKTKTMTDRYVFSHLLFSLFSLSFLAFSSCFFLSC